MTEIRADGSAQPSLDARTERTRTVVRRSRLRRLVGRLRPRRLVATWRWFCAILADIRRRARDPRLAVGVDANPLWEELTGVGWSLHKLVGALADREGLSIRLYGPALVAFDPPEVPQGPPFGSSVETIRYPIVEDLTLPPHWQELLLKVLAPFLMRADRNDVLHAHNFFLPRRMRASQRRSTPALSIVVHDLAMRRFSWTLAEETRLDLEKHLDEALARATTIVTPSEAVRAEIVAEGLAEEAAIVAIHHGPGHLAAALPPALRAAPGDAGAAAEPFALHVGTLEPRKNLETLIRAWQLARQEEARVPKLVLCGARGWKNDDLHDVIDRGRVEGWLELPGYVSQEELWRYYSGAQFVACPSHYEGFGLPLVEAMSAGTPLLLSDIAVFREVAGEAGEFVAAGDPKAWARAIVDLVRSDSRLDELGAASRARAADFSWQTAADEMLGVWQRLGADARSRRVGEGSNVGERP